LERAQWKEPSFVWTISDQSEFRRKTVLPQEMEQMFSDFIEEDLTAVSIPQVSWIHDQGVFG
jgi:hypothetical protein